MITGQHMVTRRPAMVAAAAPVAPNPAPAQRDWWKDLSLSQVICWQLTLVAVAVALGEPWPVLSAVSVAAAAALVLTTVRIRHRWLYEWTARYTRYLLRARRHNLGDPRALLNLLAPTATVGTTSNDLTFAVISEPSGLTAVLRPKTAGVHSLLTPAALLSDADEQPVPFGVQVVAHAGRHRTQPPWVWITVHAERTVDVHRDEELTQALANTLRRMTRRLSRQGLTIEPVTADELLATIAALGHINAGPGARETWRYWHTGPVAQVTLRLDGWDRLPESSALRLLEHTLTAPPGFAVTVTRSAHGGGNSAVARIAANCATALDASVTALTKLAAHYGVRMDRLDGMHPTGVAASLPIGGFPR